MSQSNFTEILLAAVDESLSSLGSSSKEAIFLHLENSFKIRRKDIPSNLTEFSRALEGIFGTGASHLEKLIAKRLHEKLGLGFELADNLEVSECVDNLKRRLLFEGECTV